MLKKSYATLENAAAFFEETVYLRSIDGVSKCDTFATPFFKRHKKGTQVQQRMESKKKTS